MNKNICPVCLQEQGEFEKHHVVWRADGGTDDPINLLRICNSCHALLTRGNKKDRIPRDMMCFAYKLAEHGLSFLIKSGAIFSEEMPFGKEFVTQQGDTSAAVVDKSLKGIGREMYSLYSQYVSGELPYSDRLRELGPL